MYSTISLQLVSFIYVLVLSLVYFLKRKYNFLESKIYKLLLINTMITLLLNMANDFIVGNELNLYFTLIATTELYYISLFLWLVLFVSYVLLTKNDQKYETVKALFKERSSSYIWVIVALILFIIFVVSRILFRYFKISSFGFDVNLIYIFGIIASLIILIILLFNSRKMAGYKNWVLLISTMILVITIYIQMMNPSVSIICSGISLITLFQYFTMENPDLKYIDELEALKVKAEQANQAKTNFLASMSHEIRTPMNAIIGLSENMLNSNTIPLEFRNDVKSINEAGSILLEIVNNILDITKVESGKTTLHNQPYSLADTISKLSQMVRINLTDRPIKFDVQINGSIPNTLMGDELKVYQVLMNILSNAVKYTKKGSIRFVIDSNIVGNKDVLTFRVIDTGIGIKKADNAKLFEKFERLDQEQTDIQGTGLGLAITKKLLDLMGGKISFESEYQRGTTFTIQLEQEIVDRAQVDFSTYQAKKIKVDKYFDGSKYKILLVDDNLLNLKVAEKMLKNYNFEITAIKSGLECLNYTKGRKYDLILMDHMMPEMDGIQTLRNLKKRAMGFDTPVVVLTANAIEGSKDMYLREGFVDYLSKPIDQVELDRILREQLKIDDNDNQVVNNTNNNQVVNNTNNNQVVNNTNNSQVINN